MVYLLHKGEAAVFSVVRALVLFDLELDSY